MKIQNQLLKIVFVIIVLVVGNVCGYSEECILKLVKCYFGFDILANFTFSVNWKKVFKIGLNIFTKN